ncbi:hypothetical protein J4233_02265 [Candidatus Pacearchaeota archaeon]|nr:hypothetical protein [Candidatus Pacearchaeota archaeon]
MKKEDLIVVAQLLAAMKDIVERLAVAERNKDAVCYDRRAKKKYRY